MALAHQLFQLLPGVTDLLLHHLAGHSAVRNAGEPDVLRTLTDSQVLLCNGRDLLLVLPNQVSDIPHCHGQEGVGGSSAEGEWRCSAEENATVTRDNRAGHSGHDDIDTTGQETLAGLGRRCERGNGVGKAVFDVEGPRQEVVEALLCGKGV